MNFYHHLNFKPIQNDIERKILGRGNAPALGNRNKRDYSNNSITKTNEIISSMKLLKSKYKGIIKPSLIFKLEINQSIDIKNYEKELLAMGINILSFAENKKGYWIVFSDDDDLQEFKRKLTIYGFEHGPKYDFFNAFEDIKDIPKQEKIGYSLLSNPLADVPEFVDIELWRLIDKDKNIQFINDLKSVFSDPSIFNITDFLITKSFVLLRVKMNKDIFNEIIEFKEVARINRPSILTFNPSTSVNININDLIINSPEENASGILIIDSGIISNHPLLEKCIGNEENFQSGENEFIDKVGHGTAVAGCAAYGDIEKCCDEKKFQATNWIFSAKVMYAENNFASDKIRAVYDQDKLVESQFKEAIDYFLSDQNNNIKVVNISLGNSDEIWHKTHYIQFPLAALIDELAYIYSNVTFIVSIGNNNPRNYYNLNQIINEYPKYLTNDDFKLINPATSALSFTVGSIAQKIKFQNPRYGNEELKIPIAEENNPSPFTRSGEGINGMIKPEVVEYGGNMILYNSYSCIRNDLGGELLLLNNSTTEKLLKYDSGTSFSTPKIANILGRLCNYYPDKSSNYIKNILLSSSDYSDNHKDCFNYIENKNELDTAVLNTYGYGLPNFEKALYSFDNRVILIDEGFIKLDNYKIYSIPLPEIFFSEKGKKKIVVTLTFLPLTKATRGDSYLGNRMEFHLYHSISIEDLSKKYSKVFNNPDYHTTVDDLKKFEIELNPKIKKRAAGCHQKAEKNFKRNPANLPKNSFSLVLINKNKWITDPIHLTSYCISVLLKHEKEIELYNQIRTNIQTRTRVR